MIGESAADDITPSPHCATGLDESKSEPDSADQSEAALWIEREGGRARHQKTIET